MCLFRAFSPLQINRCLQMCRLAHPAPPFTNPPQSPTRLRKGVWSFNHPFVSGNETPACLQPLSDGRCTLCSLQMAESVQVAESRPDSLTCWTTKPDGWQSTQVSGWIGFHANCPSASLQQLPLNVSSLVPEEPKKSTSPPEEPVLQSPAMSIRPGKAMSRHLAVCFFLIKPSDNFHNGVLKLQIASAYQRRPVLSAG